MFYRILEQALNETKELVDSGYAKNAEGVRSYYIELDGVSSSDISKFENAPWCDGSEEGTEGKRFWVKKGKDSAANKAVKSAGYKQL